MSMKIRPEYHELTDDEREAVHAWVRSHGIEPKDVLVDGVTHLAEIHQYRIEVMQRGPGGGVLRDQLADGPVVAYEFRPDRPPLPWPLRDVDWPKPVGDDAEATAGQVDHG